SHPPEVSSLPKMGPLSLGNKGFVPTGDRRPEAALEGGAQRDVDLRHGNELPQVLEARHALVRNAAGNDAVEMAEIRRDVERYAVEAHPTGNAHPNGSDLVLAVGSFFRAPHPDPDTVSVAPLAAHVEGSERVDDPALETLDIAAHVAPALPKVEHDIGHALAGPMIGVLPAASGLENREALRLKEIFGAR